MIIYFLLVKSANAVTTTISDLPSLISADPFTFKVTISGANAGTNYLKLDLAKPSTTNYFGETFNGLDWYASNDPTFYQSINIDSGADWSGEVKGKVGNPTFLQYDGPGLYRIRIRRYTTSGNYNILEANNSATDIQINFPVITLTSTPTTSVSIEPLPNDQPSIAESQPPPSLTPYFDTSQNIFLSEVMTYPDTESVEWFEIYNNNDYEITLSDWFIDDIENSGSAPKKFTISLPSKSYISHDLTGSIFNNDGDTVRLLDPTQKEIDSFQYENSEKNKTLARDSFSSDNFCIQNPSKNMANNSCLNSTISASKQISTNSPTSSITKVVSATGFLTSFITKTPFKLALPTVNQQVSFDEGEIINNEVLGLTANNRNSRKPSQPLVSFLSFNALSYSLLSALSILLKLKPRS